MPTRPTVPTRLPHDVADAVHAIRGDVETEIMATLARSGQPRTVSEIHERLIAGGANLSHRTTERSVARLHERGFLIINPRGGTVGLAAKYAVDANAVYRVARQYVGYIATGVVLS